MGKGYAEGPAAEEAERRRAEAAEATEGGVPTEPATELVLVGCTPERPERHVLGRAAELDADALFASGAAWGLRVERHRV